MARGRKAKTEEPQVDEVKQPDFDLAKRILFKDVRPAEEKGASARGELSAAWKAIEKDANLNKQGAKFVHKLHNMSEELRDDMLRTIYGLMKAMNIGISRDLVDAMGDDDAPSMPVAETKGMGIDSLATAH